MFGLMRDLREAETLGQLETFLDARLDEMEEQITQETFGRFHRHQQNQGFVFNLLARLSYYVERQSATPTSFERYLDRTPANRYDIEHVWPDTLDKYVADYPARFATRDQAAQFRDLLGGLVLLPEKVNRSLQAKPFKEKRDKYLADNLLAGSLHPAAYTNNPGFTNWIKSANLPFQSYEEFTAAAFEERQDLYRRLCLLIWSPDRVRRAAPDPAII